MNELYLDPEAALELECVEPGEQKGDSFTKALGPQAFIAAREKLGMRKPRVSKEVVANPAAANSPTVKAPAKKGKG